MTNQPWNKPATPTLTLNDALMAWEKAKKLLADAKEAELAARKVAFDLGFSDAKEGTNTLELGNGYELKGVKKLNYKLKAPEGYKGDKTDAVNDVINEMAKVGNEGTFIADRLFKWDVDLSLTEYRRLCTDKDQGDAVAAKLLTLLNNVLEISEATPTLEIKEPKGKKR